MKTKAVVFPQADSYEVREITLDNMGPDDVFVRTLVTAISPGTERWTLRGKHIGTTFPCIPGYHRIGKIEACGKNVRHYREGDIVYGSAGRWQENIVSMFGAHVGYSVAPWSAYNFVASEMPELVDLEMLSFTILVGVANRGIRFIAPQPGEKVLIIGGGIIGICAAQLAIFRGAAPIIVEKDAERASWIKSLLPKTVGADDNNLEAQLKEFAPEGFNVLYDTVGHAPTTDRLVQLMRHQGRILLQAQYFDKEKCALDLDQIKIKELTMKTTCGIDAQDRVETMQNIRSRVLKIAPLITHRFSENELVKGYDLLHEGKPFNLGIVFHWNEFAD